jgi:hypothetical protein
VVWRAAAAQIILVAPRAELHYLPGIIWMRPLPEEAAGHRTCHHPLRGSRGRRAHPRPAARTAGRHDRRRFCRQPERADGGARRAVELICVVDGLDHGTLIWRTAERNWLLPSNRLFHWAKRGLQWSYLRQDR